MNLPGAVLELGMLRAWEEKARRGGGTLELRFDGAWTASYTSARGTHTASGATLGDALTRLVMPAAKR